MRICLFFTVLHCLFTFGTLTFALTLHSPRTEASFGQNPLDFVGLSALRWDGDAAMQLNFNASEKGWETVCNHARARIALRCHYCHATFARVRMRALVRILPHILIWW